jgi:hypothetical protein
MVVTVLARPTIGTCRPSCRAPGDQHSNGPTSHRLDANSRGPFGAIVSADQAAAWLRLPSQTPPREGCVETTPTPAFSHAAGFATSEYRFTTTQLHMPRSQRHNLSTSRATLKTQLTRPTPPMHLVEGLIATDATPNQRLHQTAPSHASSGTLAACPTRSSSGRASITDSSLEMSTS